MRVDMSFPTLLNKARECLVDKVVAEQLRNELEVINKIAKDEDLLDVPVSQLPIEVQQNLLSILQASIELEKRAKSRDAYAEVAFKPRKHRVVEKLNNGGYFK